MRIFVLTEYNSDEWDRNMVLDAPEIWTDLGSAKASAQASEDYRMMDNDEDESSYNLIWDDNVMEEPSGHILYGCKGRSNTYYRITERDI